MKQQKFKKALLLCPPKYSVFNVFKNILLEISDEVSEINIRSYVRSFESKINTQIFRLPDSIRKKWVFYYQEKINKQIWTDFLEQSPDIVFVYNSEMLLPATVLKMKKTAKVIFFLGDSPFFTPTNNYFLTVLMMGDIVLAPDSFWVQQMQNVGIKNSFYFIPGIDESSYHEHPSDELLQKTESAEIMYCGMSYANSWGYKKALLMSKFAKFDLHIYGDKHWKKWFHFFPELEVKFHHSGFIPTPLLNAMFNKTKLMPVDGNPAILNGFHIRMFEALSAGVLPLIEYRIDIADQIFKGLDMEIPVFNSYDLAASVAESYLLDDTLRLATVSAMKEHVLANYNSIRNADRLMNFLLVAER